MAHYRSLVKIGEGGFGAVYSAIRDDDGLPFALKQLQREYVRNNEIRRRFAREVRLQKAMNHPNILPIIEEYLSGDLPWFVMPLAERTLADEIESGLEWNHERVLALFHDILDGVAYAHSRGVVHRDLKPWNVLLTHDGVPQISDFGLGKHLQSDTTGLTQTNYGAGTYPYAAPEQWEAFREADERADIYALGKILQAMFTRDLSPAIAASADPATPVRYRNFITKCTAHQPADRYPTVPELRAALEASVIYEEPRPAVKPVVRKLSAAKGTFSHGEKSQAVEKVAPMIGSLTIFGLPALAVFLANELLIESRASKQMPASAKDRSKLLGEIHFEQTLRPVAVIVAIVLLGSIIVYYRIRRSADAHAIYLVGAVACLMGIGAAAAAFWLGAQGYTLTKIPHLGLPLGFFAGLMMLVGLCTLVLGPIAAFILLRQFLNFSFKSLAGSGSLEGGR